jgi:hypothetical protein
MIMVDSVSSFEEGQDDMRRLLALLDAPHPTSSTECAVEVAGDDSEMWSKWVKDGVVNAF